MIKTWREWHDSKTTDAPECRLQSSNSAQRRGKVTTDPPVSVPIEATQSPAAIAAADPPLDPPGVRGNISHGLCAAP